MTTPNHVAALWAPGIWGQSALLRQTGAPRGMAYPPKIGFIEYFGTIYDGDPFGAGGPIDIYPYVFNWPYAIAPTDNVGVDFPADMIAVSWKAWLPCERTGAPPSPPFGPPVAPAYTGTVNDGLELYWATDVFHFALGDVNGGGAIAVPSVLPGGYTANLNTPFASRSPTVFADAYFDAGGPVRPAWRAGVGCSLFGAAGSASTNTALRTGPDGSGNFKWFFPIHTGVGLRKFQFRIDSAGDAWTARVSHNANGSYPYPAEGDTPDYSTSGGSGGPSAWFDCGALTPTLGTPTAYLLTFESALGASLSVRSSARTDVPLPYTVTGLGDLVAPGGYV